MNGFKVRLGDGSEIGPMDLASLRTWIAQGLVDHSSPVMRPGSRRWAPLGTIPELKGQGVAVRRRAGAAPRTLRREAASSSSASESRDRWRVRLAGGLVIAVAGVLALAAFRPDEVQPALDGAPWLQLAFALVALGLSLLPGWTLARRAARVVLFLSGFALFAAAGVLIAQGERGSALVALASAWLLVSGLIGLLAPTLGWRALALVLLPVIAGAAGLVRYGRAPVTEATRQAREWASPDRHYSDDALGLRLEPPAGWIALRAGNPLLQAPADARLSLAQPRLGGFGWLLSGPAPRGVATAEQYLERVLARRRAERPGYVAGPQANAVIGALSGRRSTAAWVDGGVRQSEIVVAGVDGWTAFALVAWMPEAGAGRGTSGLEPLAAALLARGLIAEQLRQAIDAAVAAVPHLTADSARQLMAMSEARVLEPEQAFRRSLVALAKLVPALPAAQSRELSFLASASYQGLARAQRDRLASYIERVRRGDTTSAGEDREMARLLERAERTLPPERLLRLRAYYDKAIQAAS